MSWLRWIDDAKSTSLVLAVLLVTGAVMSIGMIYSPSLLAGCISSHTRDSSDALFDTACIVAFGVAIADFLIWLLPFFLALCSIAKLVSKRPDGVPISLAAACIMFALWRKNRISPAAASR